VSAATRGADAGGAPCVLITGGAGFVGTNLAKHLLAKGADVRILDSLARPGSEENIEWLQDRFAGRVRFTRADICDPAAVAAAVADVDHVFHLAAQVAVTTSLVAPRADFETNAAGTLNLLEAARACERPPSIVFTSTNKVYGVLPDVEVTVEGQRYVPVDERLRADGISEARPLDFHSPYGCSKGAADQYVLDYSRSFGLRTVVLRMSCIYGPHQHGNEDQGWVAHFVRCALADRPITIYGDGRQVRDVLYVDDLVDAFERAWANVRELSGRAFNIGGGVAKTVSVLELLELLGRLTGNRPRISFDSWRVGDQRYYVSDIARFRAATHWQPRTQLSRGLSALCEWFDNSQPAFAFEHRDDLGAGSPMSARV
jgi:CDP-paratose 2-epimerase